VQRTKDTQGLITFLYYPQIEPAASFYGEVMGFELVEDQGWAKIYRASGNAYLGIVAGEKGFHKHQSENAVLVTVVVEDAAAWFDELEARGVKMLSSLEHREEIGILCFFLTDPGGYALEVQQFLKPGQIEVFGRQSKDSRHDKGGQE
jgi:predicted enzyme related to lactoylglutathione lyase